MTCPTCNVVHPLSPPVASTAVKFTVCRLCERTTTCVETLDGWECHVCHQSPEGGYPNHGCADRRVPYAESREYGRDTLW